MTHQYRIHKSLAGLALGALLGGLALPAAADNKPPAPTARPAPARPPVAVAATCANVAPSVSLALTPTTNQVTSPTNNSYAAGGCKRYVAEVTVERAPSGVHGIYLNGAVKTTGLNKAQCLGTELVVTYYAKKQGAASFSSLGTTTFKGKWYDPPTGGGFAPTVGCAMEPVSGANIAQGLAQPDAGKKDVYRVAVTATRGGATIPVSAGASRVAVPE